jgi:hypothetical protein
MKNIVLPVLIVTLFVGSMTLAIAFGDTERRREERFLDECQFAPAITQPDGSVSARVARAPFPYCYAELLRAQHMTTQTVQVNPMPAPSPVPTPTAPVPTPMPAPK